VLPGGSVFLRHLVVDAGDDLKIEYLKTPYDLLTAGVVNISSKKVAENGQGIDLYNSKVIDDMIAAGIVDSAKAIEEAVVNSHSAAAQLLSVRLALPYVEDME